MLSTRSPGRSLLELLLLLLLLYFLYVMPFLPPVTVFVFVYIFIYFGWRWVLVSAQASLWSAVIGATLQLGRVSFSWGSFSWSRGQALGCVGFSSCSPPALEHRLSCPSAHGIVPEQGLNPRPLHWLANSFFFFFFNYPFVVYFCGKKTCP